MARTAGAISLLLSAAVMSEALRNRRSKAGRAGTGYVKELYTWGAPAVKKDGYLPDRRLSSEGCWQGLRVVNIEPGWLGVWDSDIVSGVANIVGYWHAKQPTVRLANFSKNQPKYDYECGVEGPRPVVGKVGLHMPDLYEERADMLDGEARTLTKYFLRASYMPAQEAAAFIRSSGWKLVGTSTWDAKETHLMQHPSSMECVLSFQGTTTERIVDWWDNLRFYDVDFCGLANQVHGGFRDQLRAILDGSSWKTQIQDKLPKCKELTVIGHSLGGALANLYSYCLNAVAPGEDNNRVRFTRSTPEVMSPLF